LFSDSSYSKDMKKSLRNPIAPYVAHWLNPVRFGHLLIVETIGKEYKATIELITQWTLRGAFYLIAAGEWFPDHDDVRYSVFRYTNAVNETLDNLILARARTCMQLLDLLMGADKQSHPVLILDFLHLFYDPDVELSLRERILEQCCQYTKQLSLSNPVAVLVPNLASKEDYQQFFPVLASVADEIIPLEENSKTRVSQGALF
jgi:hypothetical protein